MEISSWNFGWGRIIPPLFWCNEVSEWKSLLLWNASNPVNQVKRGRYLSVLKKYIFDWITPQPLFSVGANFIKNDNISYINISYRRVCFFVSFFVCLFVCLLVCLVVCLFFALFFFVLVFSFIIFFVLFLFLFLFVLCFCFGLLAYFVAYFICLVVCFCCSCLIFNFDSFIFWRR